KTDSLCLFSYTLSYNIRSFIYRDIINGDLSFRQFTFHTDFQRIFCENFTEILDSPDIVKHNKDHKDHQKDKPCKVYHSLHVRIHPLSPYSFNNEEDKSSTIQRRDRKKV